MRTTALVALLAVATLAACAKPAPEPEPVPVTVEPAYTGKYK
jgi:nitrous oxide reductase accessory protein NosL